jgi:hypothetical protein
MLRIGSKPCARGQAELESNDHIMSVDAGGTREIIGVNVIVDAD